MKYLIFLSLIFLNSITSLTYETKEVVLNQVYKEILTGSNVNFYSVKLSETLGNDLAIEAESSNKNASFDSPVVLVSLVPLPNNEKDNQWVCGQLGKETCFVPNKYLMNAKDTKVYFGVYCTNCEYNLRAFYVKEEVLKDGQSKLFHLKAGDKKVFVLEEFFEAEKNWIQISSFNLKMTNYKMNVDIVHKKDASNVIQANVNANWIGGQQATIKPSSDASNYQYRVVLTALENGIFTLEARSSQAVVALDDKTLKFESVKSKQELCYSYKATEGDVTISAKSIKGDLNIRVNPGDKEINVSVKSEKEENYTLTKELRNNNVKFCVSSGDNQAFYTIQVYMNKNEENVKEYKKLLYSI